MIQNGTGGSVALVSAVVNVVDVDVVVDVVGKLKK